MVDGYDIPRQSDVTGTLNITATLPNEVFGLRTSFRADVRYTGPYFADDLNVEERSALTIVNLSANLMNENWTVRLFVNNVTDEDEPTNLQVGGFYTDNANPTLPPSQTGGWSVFPRRPREAGLQLSYRF
jgi:outer membrane receptor protein involved in Fe transport